jgi:uncharacterized protein YbjT (DUF2867 family)
MTGTAIVLGSSGLVGRALVEQLVAASHVSSVVTVTRRDAPHDAPKVINHVVDFERLADHASIFLGDWMFSCLGTTRRDAGSVAAQRRVDLDYQFAAARLAADNGVRHYLLVSSSGANASSANPYLRMKGELEQRVLQLPFERITILQPSILLGARERRRPLEAIAGSILLRLTVLPMLHRYRPIHADQVAARLVQASRERTPGQEWLRLDEIFTVQPSAAAH